MIYALQHFGTFLRICNPELSGLWWLSQAGSPFSFAAIGYFQYFLVLEQLKPSAFQKPQFLECLPVSYYLEMFV